MRSLRIADRQQNHDYSILFDPIGYAYSDVGDQKIRENLLKLFKYGINIAGISHYNDGLKDENYRQIIIQLFKDKNWNVNIHLYWAHYIIHFLILKNEREIVKLLKYNDLEIWVFLEERLKRKQDQGSMKLQGEVQELAVEEWLAGEFPFDTIEEIKTGARGADYMQIVNTPTRSGCGRIYYESKRTKDFQNGWIEKFKTDIREKGADIGVLVTQAMPADMLRMGMKAGIWICSFEEFKGLSAALRESIILVSNAIQTQENKGDKMSMLYDFLTSNEFRMQIEAIVEGFSQMKQDLDKEKTAMQKIWKQREKQIDKVFTNTVSMYGSIKGIAGNAIQEVKALELPETGMMIED